MPLPIKPLPWEGQKGWKLDSEGKAIIEPGMYSLKDRALFRHTAGVSKTRLGNYARSPIHDQDKRDHPERYPSTEAQNLGTMLESVILDPRGLDRYFVTPDDFTMRGADAKKQFAAWEAQYGKGFVVHGKEAKSAHARVEAVARNVWKRPHCRFACSGGHPFVAVYWDDPDTGLRCKGELDYVRELADGGILIADIKTTGKAASAEDFGKTYGNFEYDIQAAYFMDGVWANTGIEPEFIFVVAETSPPYEAAEFPVHQDDIDAAREHCQAMLRLVKWCRDHGEYPGYPPMQTVRRPRFSRRMTLESAAHMFAKLGIEI